MEINDFLLPYNSWSSEVIAYAHNRFLDAQTGQWLSEDPIQDGLNWYQYCNSNPTSYVDVLGLSLSEIVVEKPDSLPDLTEVLTSKDLESGRLRLTSCSYQIRKQQQTAKACVILADYFSNTEDGQRYVQDLMGYFGVLSLWDQEFRYEYAVATELIAFNQSWTKQYKEYEEELEAIEDSYYANAIQKWGVQTFEGLYNLPFMLLDVSPQNRAFLLATMEQELPKMVAEELVEEGVQKGIAKVIPVIGAASVVGDVGGLALKMDRAQDAIENTYDSYKVAEAMEESRDAAKVTETLTEYTDAVRDSQKAEAVNESGKLVNDNIPESLMQGEIDTRVYLGIKDGIIDYVGITKNVALRQEQHGDRFDFLDYGGKVTPPKCT